MWRDFTELGNVSSDHIPAKSWSSTPPMAFSSSTWTRQHKSTHHGNSSCTITGVYAKFHHLPHSPHAWIGGQGGVLEHPGAPAATAPWCLTVFHESVLTPPLLAEGKAFPAADTQIGIWSWIFKGPKAVLHCSWSWSAPTLGVFSSLTTSPQIHLNKLIQLFLYRQDLNLSI